MRAVRLLVAINVPSPYQVDFMNAVAAHPMFDLLVMYSYPKTPGRLWEDQLPRTRHLYVILGWRPTLVSKSGVFTVARGLRPEFSILSPPTFAAAEGDYFSASTYVQSRCRTQPDSSTSRLKPAQPAILDN